ncbi:erythromycin esterase family protein [Robertkochia solimangrovi]|nr:erythromycin esterase family protein [Robertkochia solimangrovi]
MSDLDGIMNRIGNARYVLLGEATHGTHEFYVWRALLSQRLIREKGFSFIGVEGDWPDCYRINRFVKNYSDTGENAYDVIHDFRRWPTWMWANWEIIGLMNWLRVYNERNSQSLKVGFYGLDVYSLGESLEAILNYLEKYDITAFDKAKEAISCFEPFGFEGSDYARATRRLVPKTCQREVIDLLTEIRRKITTFNTDPESVFNAEQNALVAVNAENYYRTMIGGGPESWNIRDRHMVTTLERLMNFHGNKAKAIIWEHNTHIGDARATEMSAHGMVNVGELLSGSHARDDVVKIGFGTYEGTVVAGHHWGDVMRIMKVPKARDASWEDILHAAGDGKNVAFATDRWKDDPLFEHPIDHRAIGVVYNNDREHYGNYVPSIIPYRYDAFIHIDSTEALHPVHIKPDGHQMPETFPWGF